VPESDRSDEFFEGLPPRNPGDDAGESDTVNSDSCSGFFWPVSKSRVVDRLTGDTPAGVFPMRYLRPIYERENLKN
jgi:hypothetical protein